MSERGETEKGVPGDQSTSPTAFQGGGNVAHVRPIMIRPSPDEAPMHDRLILVYYTKFNFQFSLM